MECLLSCHILLELAIIFHVPIIHCEIGSCDPCCPVLLFGVGVGLLDGRREGMHGLKGGRDIVNVRSEYRKLRVPGIKRREKFRRKKLEKGLGRAKLTKDFGARYGAACMSLYAANKP